MLCPRLRQLKASEPARIACLLPLCWVCISDWRNVDLGNAEAAAIGPACPALPALADRRVAAAVLHFIGSSSVWGSHLLVLGLARHRAAS